VTWAWDPFISGALLIFTLILLLFSGQTIIFLLRLVAVDRRTRRTPLNPEAKPTVGQMEDAEVDATQASAAAPTPRESSTLESEATDPAEVPMTAPAPNADDEPEKTDA
jgi:hypothetical protein